VVCQEASIAERFQGQLRGTPILQKVSTFVVLQSQSQTGPWLRKRNHSTTNIMLPKLLFTGLLHGARRKEWKHGPGSYPACRSQPRQ
jgi:hypothetical protein